MANYKQNDEENQEEKLTAEQLLSATMSSYTHKKSRNHEFVKFMFGKVSDNSLDRIDTCGVNLLFMTNQEKDKYRLKSGFFCGNRFCPYCAWRKARKDGLKMSVIMQMMVNKYKYEFLFVTATTPNVKGGFLDNEIKHLNHSFNKMMKRKKIRGWGLNRRGTDFSGVIKGYVKKIEVTYNAEREDYNPHIHAVFAVRKNYFTKNRITQKEWLDLWRDVTGQPEITQFHVQRLNMDNIDKSVQEVAKYSAKDSDYMLDQEIFDTFFSSLRQKRLMVYGGCMYDYANDYEAGQLDEWKTKDLTDYIYIVMAKFNFDSMKYETYFRHMTPEERHQILNEKLGAD